MQGKVQMLLAPAKRLAQRLQPENNLPVLFLVLWKLSCIIDDCQAAAFASEGEGAVDPVTRPPQVSVVSREVNAKSYLDKLNSFQQGRISLAQRK